MSRVGGLGPAGFPGRCNFECYTQACPGCNMTAGHFLLIHLNVYTLEERGKEERVTSPRGL